MLSLIAHLLLKLITTLFLICGAAYIYLKKKYRYFKDLGIPGPDPSMVIGNMKEAYTLKCTEPEMVDSWYKDFRNEPYIGFYNLWKPTVLVIDPELIKKITEVDFDHFTDHPQNSGNSKSDAVFDSLFAMKGHRWKIKRHIFSKLFTPKKLKEYCEYINLHNSKLLTDIKQSLNSSGEIELIKISEGHVIRMVGSVMYNIDLSQDEARISKLSELSEVFARPPTGTVIKFMLYTVAPKLFALIGLKTFPSVIWNYYSKFTNEILDSRSNTESSYNDLVGIVNKLQIKDEEINFTESVGHFFSFFAATQHSTQTTISYVLYEVARNPEVQKKLQNEVDDILNGEEDISYESLNKMTYMDDVINETMRIYTLLGVLKRVCTKPYKVDDNFTIPIDADVVIPVQSIHMDPKYFPQPHQFKPERFSGLKKLPFVFMPFGKGPRMCIGNRLAFVAIKIAVAKIISEFSLLVSPKTQSPIKFDPKTLIITVRPINGLWVKIKKRQRHDLPLT